MPEIVVVGSINFDIFLFQSRLPLKGETLTATGTREGFGGKGANQAVQSAKLGREVAFVGAVGPDERGEACRRNLESVGIDCRVVTAEAPTGLGVVQVLDDGEVHATIVEGANGAVTPEYVLEQADVFDGAAYVVLQNEIPEESVVEAIRLANGAGAKAVLNAAPARPLPAGLTTGCEYFIVNEEEAMFYLDRRIDDVAAMREAVPALKEFCPKVIVTLGGDGSLVSFDSEVHHIPAVPVDAVDTTGAGDSFVGAFVAGLTEGLSDLEAASLAAEIAAQTTTGVGAQTSMPTRGGSDDSVRAEAADPRHPAES